MKDSGQGDRRQAGRWKTGREMGDRETARKTGRQTGRREIGRETGDRQ